MMRRIPCDTISQENDLPRGLAHSLLLLDRDWARRVEDPTTEVRVCRVSFLKHYRIVQVKYFLPQKPLLLYVGYAPDQRAHLLTGNPDGYVQLAHDDGLEINSVQLASEYAAIFLEVTRPMSSIFYLINSIDEVEFRSQLTREDEEKKAFALHRYQHIVSSPAVQSEDNRYDVTLYAVMDQALERHRLRVHHDGFLTEEVETLMDGLPVTYGV